MPLCSKDLTGSSSGNMGGCDDEEIEVVQDTNNHSENGDQTCTGGIQSYCCKGFKSAPTKEELEEMAKEKAEEVAEEAAEQAALDIAAKAFCRIAVPALLAPLEAFEAFIPIIGKAVPPLLYPILQLI